MNRYRFAELHLGLQQAFAFAVTEESMEQFRRLTGDVSPIHVDEAAAKARGFAGRVVYGMLGASLFSTLAGVYLPGEHCLLHEVDAKFAKPVYIGDVLTVSGQITDMNDTFKAVTIKAQITNQRGEKVTRGVIKAGLAE